MKYDICMYSQLGPSGDICGFAIVHVDDISQPATLESLSKSRKRLHSFERVEVEVSTREKGITVAGLEIRRGRNCCTIISQETYVASYA